MEVHIYDLSFISNAIHLKFSIFWRCEQDIVCGIAELRNFQFALAKLIKNNLEIQNYTSEFFGIMDCMLLIICIEILLFLRRQKLMMERVLIFYKVRMMVAQVAMLSH